MYSVLVVDDEEPVLDSFAYLIAQKSTDFCLCTKARSGDEALSLIFAHKPDVVFMDISMPGKDGLEVIEQARPIFPNIIFILSTAYERFDLAQRAIPLGIFAYLVKPVSKKTFFATMDEVLSVLNKRKTPPEEVQKQKKHFLSETIHQPMSQNQWDEISSLFHFTQEQFCIVFVQCPAEIRTELLKRVSFRYQVYECNYLSLLQLLIPMPRDNIADPATDINAIAQELAPEGSLCAAAAGSTVCGKDLYISVREAFAALNSRNAAQLIQEQSLVADFRRALVDAEISNTDDVHNAFTRLWQYVFAVSTFEQGLFKMHGFLTLALEDLFKVFSDNAQHPPVMDITGDISALSSLREWESWSENAIALLCSEYSRIRTCKYPLPLTKAIQFIEEHYTTPLQLSTIAEKTNVSEPYISRLFSEYLHTSFSDYVTFLRIQKAKELLSSPLSIKEVAYTVGFQDQNYFTRIFHKNTGTTPSQFRTGLAHE